MIPRLAAPIAACACLLFVAPAVAAQSVIKHVFVIAMENTDAATIYGNKVEAPYINNVLIPRYAHAKNFNDRLPDSPSEPHYILMEAGKHAFADVTFLTNDDPSAANSTASRRHLTWQIDSSQSITWMTYQESINSTTGRCPIVSYGFYAAKHNPFVFFQDVSGSPPSKTSGKCISHTKPYSSFAADLAANRIANYVFITPNLCHDMHGDPLCPAGSRVTAGDKWLSSNLPRIIRWANKNSSAIFIVWDEGAATTKIPFLAIGPGVRTNFSNNVVFDHGSLIKSIERIFNLPFLPAVAKKNDLSSLFKPSFFP